MLWKLPKQVVQIAANGNFLYAGYFGFERPTTGICFETHKQTKELKVIIRSTGQTPCFNQLFEFLKTIDNYFDSKSFLKIEYLLGVKAVWKLVSNGCSTVCLRIQNPHTVIRENNRMWIGKPLSLSRTRLSSMAKMHTPFRIPAFARRTFPGIQGWHP